MDPHLQVGCALPFLLKTDGGLMEVGSKKISHLIAEFREQDSYVNSDYDSDDSSARLSKSGLTNSIITTAESLLSVARSAERIPGAPEPKVTIRFSRIEEDPEGGHEDERVSQTFEAVRKMGIELIFGDLGEFELLDLPRPSEERTWRPSRKINLDPTALMGLCSDVLHHPLPLDEEGARARFYRPTEILSSGGAKDGEGPGQSQNSRELVKNLLEEMELPMIEEMRDVLGEDGGEIEFWTTKEAMRYLVEAFGSDEVVGAGMEQRRMRRLAGLEDGDFFEGSRYEGHEGVLKGLKVKVYDDARPSTPLCAEGMSSFQVSISRTCSQFVAEYHADPTSPSLPNFLQARRLPVPKVASFTLPFTVVSLVSLERGAAEGMTTLLMGNIVFRELFAQPRWKVRGWCQGNYEMGGVQAAVWMLPYRSLGEGKRVKFEKGDYSHPPR